MRIGALMLSAFGALVGAGLSAYGLFSLYLPSQLFGAVALGFCALALLGVLRTRDNLSFGLRAQVIALIGFAVSTAIWLILLHQHEGSPLGNVLLSIFVWAGLPSLLMVLGAGLFRRSELQPQSSM